MSQRLGRAFKRWWSDGPFSHRGDGVAVIAEAAFRAGYLLAVRRDREEQESREALAKAEARIAAQVAAGGLAGERELTPEESARAAAGLLEAVERAAGKRRVA